VTVVATRVVVHGAAGRMGRRLVALARQDEGLEVAGALEAAGHPELGTDAGVLAGIGEIGVPLEGSLARVTSDFDVVVDFSIPRAGLEIAREAARRGKALVIGTTGFSKEERREIEALAAGIACVMTPNMSVGVNVLFKAVEYVANALGRGFDAEVLEAHHRFKADAPSGTAVRLAEGIARAWSIDLSREAVYGRSGRPGPRRDEEIGILALRGGDIVGEHTVVFAGIGERIELTHRAHSRDTFASGALRAAKWVVTQPPGLYDMMHVLGL